VGGAAGEDLERLPEDLPEVVASLTAAFEAYERALREGNLETMAESFATGDDVVRFGIADRQRGATELAAWRAAQPRLPPGRRLFETSVATFGTSFGIVTTCFDYPGRAAVGRQSQTWVRFGDRWRIVHAHVSEVT
jgi:hypothetical protein